MYRSAPILGSVWRAGLTAALAVASVALVAGCSSSVPKCAAGTADCTSILFLGNSYTYVNDLPSTFARLADAGRHQVDTEMVANGGETLMQHAQSADSVGRIASQRWTYVVMQEQSQTPATQAGRQETGGAAQSLAEKARAAGARPLLFVTAAHRDGLPEAGLSTYEAMQRAVDDGYRWVASRTGLAEVPAGYVWLLARQHHPEIQLWQSDGSHPTTEGTYLEVCVFYDSIFRQPSVGLSFGDGLSDDVARTLQSEADAAVLPNLSVWGLDS